MSVNRYTFSNGTTWIADFDPDMEDIRVFFGANKGEELEDISFIGGHHLYEHHMFRGRNLRDSIRRTRTLENCRILTDGTTNVHFCHAQFYGPVEVEGQIDRVLAMALNGVIKDHIDPHEHKLEQRICSQEYRIKRDSDRMAAAYEAALMDVYQGTNYSRSLQQELDNMQRLTIEQMYFIRDTTFDPSNTTVVTMSNLPDSELEPKMAGFMDRQSKIVIPDYRITLPTRAGTFEDNTIDLDDIHANTCYVQHVIRGMEPGPDTDLDQLAALQVIATVLARGDTSTLYREMRLKRGQTYHTKANVELSRPEIILDINYTAEPEFLTSNMGLFQTTLDKLGSARIPMHEFERYREIAGDEYRRKMEDSEDRGERHIELSTLNMFVPPEEFEQRIREVTPAMARSAVETFTPGMKTVILYPMREIPQNRKLPKDEALARRRAMT
jgi:predicted Zn-dependent peptidase